MARQIRIEYPGAIYHITSRGNAQQAIFETKADSFCSRTGLQALSMERLRLLFDGSSLSPFNRNKRKQPIERDETS